MSASQMRHSATGCVPPPVTRESCSESWTIADFEATKVPPKAERHGMASDGMVDRSQAFEKGSVKESGARGGGGRRNRLEWKEDGQVIQKPGNRKSQVVAIPQRDEVNCGSSNRAGGSDRRRAKSRSG
jgi:hypothetical protein